MDKDEALRMALEALETVVVDVKTTPTAYEIQRQAITAIREALAQPEQEPVAWLNRDSVDGCWHVSAFKTDNLEPSIPLYKHPAPQRKWVGLTVREIEWCFDDANDARIVAARSIEAKLREKNT